MPGKTQAQCAGSFTADCAILLLQIMDFLDPQNERRSRTRLFLGYCLVALAIGIATLILLYWSYGYNVDRQGDVTQNGLLFISSQPAGASVYLNNTRYKANTNTRVTTQAGRYLLRIAKQGYRDWQRTVVVAGGDVQHFDYPFLFPTTLKTSSLADLDTDPSVATQSPDKRWLLLGEPTKSGDFTEYDLKDPAKPIASEVVLPDGSFTPGIGTQTWAPVEWASDNRHVLLLHTYASVAGTQHEYIVLNRDTPASSTNLTNTLKLAQTDSVSLFNSRVDQFYVYSIADQTLRRLNGSNAAEVSILPHILAFKASASDKILYVTDQSPTGKATPGKVSVVLQVGQQTYTLRTLPPAGNGSYVIDLAEYSGDWYAAVASTTDSSVYVYQNPQNQATTGPDDYPAPWRRLPLANPSYLSFSDNAQFLLAESGQNFAVYDLENIGQYYYRATQPMDPPQTHAVWMGGDQLAYVSGGKLVAFDYDYQNQQTLVDANAAFVPFFSGDFSYLYALRSSGLAGPKPALTSTPLVVKP